MCGKMSYNKNIQQVILTVPHAKCPETNESLLNHSCDILSEKFGKLLHKKITCTKSKLFIGDINRDVIDLNRKESRNTSFRRNVRNNMTAKSILIDVHSNEPDSYKFGKYDVSLISDDDELKNNIYGALTQSGYKVGLFNVHPIDDILIEAKEKGIEKSILVEINEKHRNNPVILEDIADKIAEQICIG